MDFSPDINLKLGRIVVWISEASSKLDLLLLILSLEKFCFLKGLR